VNKADLIRKIAQDAGLSKKAATQVLDTILRRITKKLKKGKTVTFMGFGTFRVLERKKRKGRNPRSGEVIKIPAARVPQFSAGSELKRAVNWEERSPTIES
jgi:nucleoid DNA-binding protein